MYQMGIQVKDIPTHWLKPYDFDFGTFFQIKNFQMEFKI